MALSPRQLPARHGGLTPLPSGATLPLCSGLGGRPPTGARCCRRGEIISRAINNGRSGWFWRFQLHPMRPGDNSRRLGHVGWAQGTPEQIDKPATPSFSVCVGGGGHWPEGAFQCGVTGPKGSFGVGSLARRGLSVWDHWPDGVFQCGITGPTGSFSVGSLARRGLVLTVLGAGPRSSSQGHLCYLCTTQLRPEWCNNYTTQGS
jgi:hypothetical protein